MSHCARRSSTASSWPIRPAARFRFRHALLAEAIYATILPGEREELHARLADELARSEAATPAELAPHWAAAGRTTEALVASVEAARQADAVFGLAEALAHLERALTLWDTVPERRPSSLGSTSPSSARGLPSSPAKRAPPRTRSSSPSRRSTSSARATRHARRSCTSASARTCSRAAAATPSSPPSSAPSSSCRRNRPRRSGRRPWQRSAADLMVAGATTSHCRSASRRSTLAREVGAHESEVRALTMLGSDLAYLGRGEEGLDQLSQALRARRTRLAIPSACNGRTSRSPTC